VPKTELLRAGLVPDKDVKTRFAGSHAAALLSLWNGTADAAATADAALRHYARDGRYEYCDFPADQIGRRRTPADVKAVFDACPDGKLVAIHAAAIPGTPFAVRGDLPDDLKAVIKASLLSTPQDPEFIRAARLWYIDPSIEMKLPNVFAYYDGVREMATLLDLDLRRLN
jgi:ABC-type phosphate/phosphonate transport system substrate-binding protein